jgi:hypothetical protein
MSDHVRDWDDERLSTAFLTSYSPRIEGQVNREREAYQALHEARTRIAELEAENYDLKHEVGVLTRLRPYADHEWPGVLETMRMCWKAEAALAEREARRCETCLECCTHLDNTKMVYRTCGMASNPCEDGVLPACFYCSEWTARAEEGSGNEQTR